MCLLIGGNFGISCNTYHVDMGRGQEDSWQQRALMRKRATNSEAYIAFKLIGVHCYFRQILCYRITAL